MKKLLVLALVLTFSTTLIANAARDGSGHVRGLEKPSAEERRDAEVEKIRNDIEKIRQSKTMSYNVKMQRIAVLETRLKNIENTRLQAKRRQIYND